ncbi:dienelactone hydrolase family protein [Marinomonas algicola]|uniref:dienelactone hydrolase family protein n=1 Tax=Marinomonas algicola TaxID=2773454 RepID=UPI00174AA4C2|nr:dienelactone hydrolase family protein [Marinomonas algicola]
MTEKTNVASSTVSAIPQEAFDWYDEYAHGDIDRRTFLSRLGALGVAGLSMSMVAGALIPNYALAEQVSFNDPDIIASYEEFDSPSGHGKGNGYLVVPKELQGNAPVVLVVHENRGLNPYIEDVARRLAKVGFIAFAPDILFSVGGYPGNDDEGRALQKSLDSAKMEEDFKAAARFLKNHELSNAKLGVIGFCYGGYISNMLAAEMPDIINAAVPFYGTPPKANIDQIKAPMMLQFGELDKRVNATWGEYEAALKANQVDYQAFVYEDVNHGFHNDSTARYDEASAELAWSRSVDFFKAQLA